MTEEISRSEAGISVEVIEKQPQTFDSKRSSYFELRPFDSSHIYPRKTNFKFSQEIPKLWFRNSSVLTHFVNGINLFISDFELFMVRVLKSQLPTIQDPVFKQQVCGFVGQESSHSSAHAKYNQTLREQGYQFESFAKILKFVFAKVLPKLGTKLGLATIAGFEHLTSLLAEITLKYDFFETAHPTMSELWCWHAAEELEHKTMAFDVLQSVDRSYLLRILGLVLGTAIVSVLTVSGMVLLALQDSHFFSWKTCADLNRLFFTEFKLIPRILNRLIVYFRPDFHPSQQETQHYAAKVFEI